MKKLSITFLLVFAFTVFIAGDSYARACHGPYTEGGVVVDGTPPIIGSGDPNPDPECFPVGNSWQYLECGVDFVAPAIVILKARKKFSFGVVLR